MLHALLVDDDNDFLTGLAEITKQEGFGVMLAHSLEEARECIGRGPVDLVVIDLMLPDGKGIGLLKELKDTTRSDVIIISGYDGPQPTD